MDYSLQTDKIQQYKDDYYSQNKKNVFFKNEQKFHLAQSVSNHFDLDELLYNTCWIIPNTNKIYVEYTVFKHYACPDNYCQIIGKLIELSKRCVETHGHFEVHVNLDTFSVTAAERYKGFIQLFCEQSQASGTPLSEDLSCLYLYNIPAMMDSISRMLSPLVPPEMREKRKMFKKDVSDQLLKTLHSAI